MHIYDIKESGKYTDGFKSGNISFKVRKTEDTTYQNKLSEVSDKIKKMGMSIKESQQVKQKRELIPTGISWDNVHINNYTSHRQHQKTNQIATPKNLKE